MDVDRQDCGMSAAAASGRPSSHREADRLLSVAESDTLASMPDIFVS